MSIAVDIVGAIARPLLRVGEVHDAEPGLCVDSIVKRFDRRGKTGPCSAAIARRELKAS